MKSLYILLLIPMVLYANEPFWQKIIDYPTIDARDITFDSHGYLYVAGGNGGGVCSSSDGINNWELLGLGNKYIDKILIDTKGYIFAGNDGKLYRSTDSGKTWENISSRIGWTIDNRGWIINKRGHLFIGEYRTTDNGDTWENEYKGMGEYFSYAMNSEGHIFRGGLGHKETICRSTDDGDNWEVVFVAGDSPGEGVEYNRMIFTKKEPLGFVQAHKTIDNGRSWHRVDFAKERVGYPLTLDSMGHVYSGVAFITPPYYKYIYKFLKDSTWVPMDTSGLNGVDEFNTMATSPNGYIYLAAHNGGLYRSRDRYVSVPEAQEPPGSKDRLSASPNPFSDYIEISGISPPAMGWGEDRIRIYNALGEIVLTVGAIHELPLRIDVSGLPPGVYFVRLGDQAYKFLKISPSGGG